MSWTDERVAILRRMFERGESFSVIGGELGITRNAAIGKAHRLGLYRDAPAQLGGRPKSEKPRRIRERRITVVKPSKRLPPGIHAAPAGTPGEVVPLHIGLADLNESTCKWPFGTATPYTFCGHASLGGLPYCEAHSRIAYRPPDERRQKSSAKHSLWHAQRAA